MCGIAGIININNPIDISSLKQMTDIIRHRGPDDEGFYLWEKSKELFAYGEDTSADIKNDIKVSIDDFKNEKFNLGLGHRRLSIIDVSDKAHQPMSCSDLVITYNGEIYNYIEIREELRKAGYHFKTEGDAEVIINAYDHWGENCVEYFNGMWAFAIWDKHNHKLFCSRDRLGEKPFYYYFSNEQFVFGSEIKQLVKYGIKPQVNEKILFSFLFYGIHDFSEETFFKDIYSLQGGFNLSVKLDIAEEKVNARKYRYWEIDTNKSVKCNSFEEEAQLIGRELKKSVSLRLRSDVEVGSCLSGGLDSSSVVTLACMQLENKKYDISNFKTFTSCYDDSKEVDERYYSDLVVKNSGCSNIKAKPNTTKLKMDFDKLVWHQDEPFASLSIFAGWCVMEKAKESGVKVLLDGQGGDETLLGYERFYAYLLREKILKFKFIDFINEFKLSSKNSKLTPKMLLGYFIYFNNKQIRKRRLKLKYSKFLNPGFISRFRNLDIVDGMLQFKQIDDMKKYELIRSISHLLRYEDRNSMANSIESRVPFLDIVFVDKAISIPDEYKLRGGWTKAVLRKYMEDKMPEEVVYRKNKLGFSVPQTLWLDELNDYFRDSLLHDTKSSKYFNMNNIKEIFDNKTNADMRFKFIVVETWMRVFDVSC